MDAKTTASGNGLQVGIVGAGVAGLSAAIALRRIGHNVEVGITSTTPPRTLQLCLQHDRHVETLLNPWYSRFSSALNSKTKMVPLFPFHQTGVEFFNIGGSTLSKLEASRTSR